MMNLQEKLSGLKGLVSQSHSKRRFKGDLTLDMISPPLGDFRHTMHVGRGGDVFGDTSFLSNHGGNANGNGNGNDGDSTVSSPDNKIGAFFSRTLRNIRRGSEQRGGGGGGGARGGGGGAKELSPPPPALSPIIKNAISLPRLDLDLANGGGGGGGAVRVLFPSSHSTPQDKSSYDLVSGFVTLPRLSRSERQQPSVSVPTSCSPSALHRGSLTDATDAILASVSMATPSDPAPDSAPFTAFSDSLPSLSSLDAFTLDLGPSLMSEVFGLIDGHAPLAWDGEGAEPTCDGEEEMDSATISYVDSLLKEEIKTPNGAEFEDDGEETDAVSVPEGACPRVAVAMESQRFQNATDVLARHYGGKGRSQISESDAVTMKNKTTYNYTDDEDEIKV